MDSLKSEKNFKGVHIYEEFKKITGNAVVRLFFGVSHSDENDVNSLVARSGKLINDTYSQLTHPLILLFGKDIIKLRLTQKHEEIIESSKWFKETIQELIKKKTEDRGNTAQAFRGLVDLLVEHNEKNAHNPDRCFNEKEIIGSFSVFFTGGMETTAHLTTAASYFMIKHPEWYQKISHEIETVIGKDLKSIDYEKLSSMELLTAFLKETLRYIAPLAGLAPMVVAEDHTLGGYNISRGTLVSVSIPTLCHHPSSYTKPEEFRPERWLNAEEKAKIDPYTDLAFSAGNRNCIGQNMAKIEAKIILIIFMSTFKK